MAKEITVTFQNGGIFNGTANSYTINGETTYYFDIDKRYRVVITSDGQIVSQQYQNTNGAWYNINIIAKVEIKDISSGGVTVEYLNENYYNKNETDGRYVKKTGDVMTGTLTFKNNKGIWFNGENGTESENYGFLFCYNGLYRETNTPDTEAFNFRIKTYFSGETFRSATETFYSGAWLYFKDNNNNIKIQVLNNSDNAAIHLFNNNSIVLHTGAPETVEQYITLSGNEINGGNNSSIYVNTKLYQNRDLIVQGAWIYVEDSENPSSNDSNLQIRHDSIMILQNRNSQNAYYSYISYNGLTVQPNNSGPKSEYQYNHMSHKPAGTAFSVDGTNLHIYKGGRVVLHSGEAATTEQFVQYNNRGMIVYNAGNNFTYTMNANTARFEIANAFTLLASTYNLMSFTAGSQLQLRDANGVILVGNATQALNNAFFGDTFLTALNMLIQQIQDNIKATSPLYQIVSAINFNGQDYGGGFQAGGGSSRGGGVGRRT